MGDSQEKIKYLKNLQRFEALVSRDHSGQSLDGGGQADAFFKIAPSMFTPSKLRHFEEDEFYYNILKVSGRLEHGERLHNISWRVMNKNRQVSQLKTRKRDGVKNIYKVITHRKQVVSASSASNLPTMNSTVGPRHTASTSNIASVPHSTGSLFKKPVSTLFNKTAHVTHNTNTTSANSNSGNGQKQHSLFKTGLQPMASKTVVLNAEQQQQQQQQQKVYYSSDEDSYSSDEDESSSEISDDEEDDEDFYNEQPYGAYANAHVASNAGTPLEKDSNTNNDVNMEGQRAYHGTGRGSNKRKSPYDVAGHDFDKDTDSVFSGADSRMDKECRKKWDKLMLAKYHNKKASSLSPASAMLDSKHIKTDAHAIHGHLDRDSDYIRNDMLLDNQSSVSSEERHTHTNNHSNTNGNTATMPLPHNPLVPTTSNTSSNNQVLFRRGSFGSIVSDATRKRYLHPSNAPPAAQTLLPIAFQTHMFVPNNISLQRREMEQRKILLHNPEETSALQSGAGLRKEEEEEEEEEEDSDDGSDAEEEEESLFYSEKNRELKLQNKQPVSLFQTDTNQAYPSRKHSPLPHHATPPTSSLFTGGRTRG